MQFTEVGEGEKIKSSILFMLRLRFLLNNKMKISGKQWIYEYEVLKIRQS